MTSCRGVSVFWPAVGAGRLCLTVGTGPQLDDSYWSNPSMSGVMLTKSTRGVFEPVLV